MKKHFFFIIFLVIFIFPFVGQADTIDYTALSYRGFDDIQFYLEKQGDSLFFVVRAKTEGWIAIGFNPESMMYKANVIIGYVDNGTVYLEDHYGNGKITHSPDKKLGGTDDITPVYGEEKNGWTLLAFLIPLNSADPYDGIIYPDKTNKIILAYSSSDNIKMKHSRRYVLDNMGY